MNISKNAMPSIDQLANEYLNSSGRAGRSIGRQDAESFQSILKGKQIAAGKPETLRFSKHATSRLQDRQIQLTNEQLDRLNEGSQKAGEKGINESLVLVDDLAFIVNIKNNTVVTAMDSTKADESVYTNIDGAVIA